MSNRANPLELLIRRLEANCPLTGEERDAILSLPVTTRTLEPAMYLLREGEPPRHCAILVSGFAFRQKLTGDGARQIVSLHIPGDPLDFQTMLLDTADHNIQALSRADVLLINRTALQDLIAQHGGIARAVIANMLVENSISREWQLNVGRRDARSRLAHLLVEFAMRLDAQGLTGLDGYELPMTQEQLGDALGLTSVHVNRTLKSLETDGLIQRKGRRIQFPRIGDLRRIADFSAIYLHLSSSRA